MKIDLTKEEIAMLIYITQKVTIFKCNGLFAITDLKELEYCILKNKLKKYFFENEVVK